MIELRTISAAAVLLAGLASGTAQAQVELTQKPRIPSPGTVVEKPTTLLSVLAAKKTGHDKCIGQGHENSTGNGHEEGECDEAPPEETPTGPVATTICDVDASAVVESSWSRATCAVVAVNENYLTAVAAANEGYPTELTAYAADTAALVTSPATIDMLSAYGIEVLNDLGNGGNLADIIGPINPPQPKDELFGSVTLSTAGVQSYTGALTDYTLNKTTTVIDSLGNGGNLADIIGPINPPQPKRDATVALSGSSVTLSSSLASVSVDSQPAASYTTDIGAYATQSIDAVLVGGNYDGGNLADVIGPINPPQPKFPQYSYTSGF